MNEEERKMLAFLAKCVYKIATGSAVNDFSSNEIQSLQNICDDLGADDIAEDAFRW